MRNKKDCKFRIDERLESIFWRKLSCYITRAAVSQLERRYRVLSVESSKGVELLLVPSDAAYTELVDAFCSDVFTVGLHVASVRGDRVLLHLSAGLIIQDVIVRGYLRLPEQLVKKLLYGKPLVVTPRGLELDLSCDPVAVLDSMREFIAWARVKRADGKLLIKPLVDAGWYLRSGV